MSQHEQTPKIIGPVIAPSISIVIALALALTGCVGEETTEIASFPETKSECLATALPNSYVVHWKDGSVSVARGYTRDDFEKEIFEPNKDDIRLAEQDQRIQIQPYALTPQATENVSNTWGLAAVGAEQAWTAGAYGEGVTVAVVDSGVDITHPQLKGRIEINDKEIPGNGIDDDDNGYIDDVNGWDFDRDTNEVGDSAGHGTHVAGIIAAEHDKGEAKGLAPKAKILPLDFMNSEGSGAIGDAILALQYAADRGARVINASWGGAPCSQTLARTISDLAAKNIVFVAAAGNSGVNLDEIPEYPAAFTGPTQITVGASTARGYTAAFSNFSYHYVHLFAPGAQIFSTWPGGRTASLSGTSMAAPFVSAAAALLIGKNPSLTAQQVRTALFKHVDPGNFAAATQGRLNVPNAL